MLWIGAYRDNEVSPSHPLVLALEEVRKAGARMTDLRLEPLSLEQVRAARGRHAARAPRAELVEPARRRWCTRRRAATPSSCSSSW